LVRKAIYDIWGWRSGPQYVYLNLWKCWYHPNSAPVNLYYPCTNVGCCSIEFEIKQAGAVAEVIINNSNGLGNCVSPCFEVCSLFPETSTYQLPKMSINDNTDGIDNSIKIIPNPTTGIFDLVYSTSAAGLHILKVADINGFEVFTQSTNAQNGSNTLKFDMTQLPIGVYYIQIFSNGLMISNTKFIKN
jgi:hypothetical protein